MRSPIAVLGTSYFSGIGIFAMNDEHLVVAWIDDKGNHSNVKKVEIVQRVMECNCDIDKWDECNCDTDNVFIYQGNEYNLDDFMRVDYGKS